MRRSQSTAMSRPLYFHTFQLDTRCKQLHQQTTRTSRRHKVHMVALAAPVALLYVPFGHSWQLVFKYVPLPGETSPNKPAGPASVVINNRGEQH